MNKKGFLDNRPLLERVHEVHNNMYAFSIPTNTRMKDPIIGQCSIHGEFKTTPATVIYKQCGCPKCKGQLILTARIARNHKNRPFTKEQFIDAANKIHFNTYEYEKVTYKNMHTGVVITCKEHGDWVVRPSDHINGRNGCPKCRSSYSERVIMNWLTTHHIRYEYNKQFETLRLEDNNYPLYCDFYCTDHNLIIEYDGQQHFRESFNRDKYGLSRIQYCDQAKTKWAQENNIPLYRINYDEDIVSHLERIFDHSIRI